MAACCRLERRGTNERCLAFEGHAFYAFSDEKLVPALPWPFPVIVQCCETEKAMCVDAKVNLAHRNYYRGSLGSGCDGYLLVFVVKIRRRPTQTVLRPIRLNVVGQWLLWHVALVWSGLLMRLKESGGLNGW